MILSMLPITALATYSVDEDVTTVTEQVSQPALRSMMPLKEVKKTLDLTAYLPHELQAFPVSKLQEMLEMQETPAVYVKRNYIEGTYVLIDGDDYTAFGSSETIDLYGDGRQEWLRLEVIGGTADQLNPNNVRYVVTVKMTPLKSLFVSQVYTHDRGRITILDNYTSISGNYSSAGELKWRILNLGTTYKMKLFEAAPETNIGIWAYYLGLELNSVYENVNVKAIRDRDNSDVTSILFGQTDMSVSGGMARSVEDKWDVITFTLWREGESQKSTVSFDIKLREVGVVFGDRMRYMPMPPICVQMCGIRTVSTTTARKAMMKIPSCLSRDSRLM